VTNGTAVKETGACFATEVCAVTMTMFVTDNGHLFWRKADIDVMFYGCFAASVAGQPATIITILNLLANIPNG